MEIRKEPKGRILRKGEVYQKERKRYIYRYRDGLGRLKAIYSTDLAKLREREKEFQKDEIEGIDVYIAGKATLNYCFDRYIDRKHNLRANTKTNYIYMYNRFVRNTLGKKLIRNIVFSEIISFYQELISMGLKVNTLDNIHTVLHPTFTMAVRDNIIRNNPTDGALAELKKDWGKNKGIRHALTRDEQNALIKFLENNENFNHWLPMITVFLGTGLRVGELCGLSWDNVDFENRTITVDHALVYLFKKEEKHGKTHAEITRPKTEAGIRVIPMLDSVYKALKNEYEIQKDIGFCKYCLNGVTNFVFYNRYGMPYNQQPINSAIKRIADAYNVEEEIKAAKQNREPLLLPKFSCHCLRHTFATRLCEVETNQKVIQSIMGHANIETTMDIYAEATKERNTETMVKFSREWDVIMQGFK